MATGEQVSTLRYAAFPAVSHATWFPISSHHGSLVYIALSFTLLSHTPKHLHSDTRNHGSDLCETNDISLRGVDDMRLVVGCYAQCSSTSGCRLRCVGVDEGYPSSPGPQRCVGAKGGLTRARRRGKRSEERSGRTMAGDQRPRAVSSGRQAGRRAGSGGKTLTLCGAVVAICQAMTDRHARRSTSDISRGIFSSHQRSPHPPS